MASPTVFAFSKLTGTGSIYNFEQAFRLVHKIAPVWEQLRVSSVTKNERELKFINRVTPSKNIQEVFNVFAGDYELVPKTYAKASGNTFGFISNPAKFNTLSADRKLQVSNYLLNNREQFNKHLALSCKLITDTVEKEFTKGTNIDGFLPKELSKIGYKSGDSHFSTIAELIKQSYKDIATAPINAKVNWVARTYIPIMNKLMYETISEHGMSTASHIFNSFKNNGFNIMGGSLNDVTTPGSFKEIYENKPTLKFDRIFIGGNKVQGGEVNIIKTDHNTLSSKQYLAQMIEGQEEFNKKYEEIYRELTKCLNDIQLTNVYKTQMNKLYPICKLFKDIAIKDPRTTVYISGFYGKKNRNSVYREIVHQAVVNLKEANISSFTSALSIVEKLEKLVIDSAAKARDLRLKFISSTKASSDELLMTVKMIKKPCHLTIKDFNNFDEALNRLYFQLKTSSSESDFLNSKEEFKNYLSKLSNRRDLIKEQFKLNEEEITHKALEIDDAALRSIYIEMKKRLNTERMNLCIYFSDVVDKYFTDLKIQNTGKPLTKKQVEDIEELVVAFRRARISSRFTKKLDKLSEAYQLNADVFTIMRLMSDIIEESGYIPFIHGLFKALGLFTSGFDWERFEKNITMHLILNSFDVDVRYMDIPEVEIGSDDHKLKAKDGSGFPQTVSRFIRDLARCMDQELINLTTNPIHPLYSIYNHLIDSLERYFKVNRSLPSLSELVLDMVNNDKLGKVKRYLSSGRISMYFTTDGKVKYKSVVENSKITKIDISNAPYWKGYNSKWLENASREMKNIDTKYLGVVINGSMNTAYKNAKIISESVFDSMFMQAINMVDNYWSLKYSGSLPLPMNTELLLKGGALIDTKAFHDISQATVIPEAVPFYIVSINAIYYYVHEVANKAKTSSGYVQTTKFSPLSTLYPITEIFGPKYQATVQTLSMAQLTTIISILNDIWNTTNGQLHEKLSTSIDMVLNELNASIMITDDLQRQLLESNFQITNTFSKSIINNLDDAFNMISEVFKSSVENSFNFNDPESEQVAFEKFLNKAYKKILSVPSESRMSELKNLLQVDGKELDSSETDFLKFMDLGLGPFVICLQSYANIFKLFDYFQIELKNNTIVEIDLREKKFIPYEETEPISMWNYIQGRLSDDDINYNLMLNPIVQEYNGVLLNKMWEKFAKTKKLEVPQFWAPTKRSTWPTEPKISCEYAKTYQYPHFTRLLRQIYPTIKAKTFDDYFINALQEFRSDVDHTLHAFMSYPGMNDRTIRIVEHELHDNLEISKILDNDEIKKIRALFQATPIYKEKTPVSPAYLENNEPGYYIDLSAKTKITSDEDFATAVSTGVGMNDTPNVREIPSLQSGEQVVPGIALTRRHMSIANDGTVDREYNMHLINYDAYADDWDNYDLYVNEDYFQLRSLSGENPLININYGQEGTEAVDTWTDWVIYNLAECNSPDFVIPHRIVQRFQASPILRDIIKPLIVTSRKYQIDYTLNKIGKYVCNPITQNIMCRSLTEENKSRIDYSYFSPTCINSFIAKIPWMLNALIATRDGIEGNVIYFDIIRQTEELTELIRILKDVYSDISPRLTPLEFLQSTSSDKEHVLGELMVMARSTLDEIQIVKMEWANKFKFGYMTDVHFPDFKNKDSLAWLKEFADDVFRAPIFSSNFKVIYECLATQVWNSLIANSYPIYFLPIIPDIDNEVVEAIRIGLKTSIEKGEYLKNDIQASLDQFIGNLKPGIGFRYNEQTDHFGPDVLKGGIKKLIRITEIKDKNGRTVTKRKTVGLYDPKTNKKIKIDDIKPSSSTSSASGKTLGRIFEVPVFTREQINKAVKAVMEANKNKSVTPYMPPKPNITVTSSPVSNTDIPKPTVPPSSSLSSSRTETEDSILTFDYSDVKEEDDDNKDITASPKSVSSNITENESSEVERFDENNFIFSDEIGTKDDTNNKPKDIIIDNQGEQDKNNMTDPQTFDANNDKLNEPIPDALTYSEEDGDQAYYFSYNLEETDDEVIKIPRAGIKDNALLKLTIEQKNNGSEYSFKYMNPLEQHWQDVTAQVTDNEPYFTIPKSWIRMLLELKRRGGKENITERYFLYNPSNAQITIIKDKEAQVAYKMLDDLCNKSYRYAKIDDLSIITLQEVQELKQHLHEALGKIIQGEEAPKYYEHDKNYGYFYHTLSNLINSSIGNRNLFYLCTNITMVEELENVLSEHDPSKLMSLKGLPPKYKELLKNKRLNSMIMANENATAIKYLNPNNLEALLLRMYVALLPAVLSCLSNIKTYLKPLTELLRTIDNIKDEDNKKTLYNKYRGNYEKFKTLYKYIDDHLDKLSGTKSGKGKGKRVGDTRIFNNNNTINRKAFSDKLFGGSFEVETGGVKLYYTFLGTHIINELREKLFADYTKMQAQVVNTLEGGVEDISKVVTGNKDDWKKNPLIVFAQQYLTKLNQHDKKRIIDLYKDPLFPVNGRNWKADINYLQDNAIMMMDLHTMWNSNILNYVDSASRVGLLKITNMTTIQTWNKVIYPLVEGDVGKITETLTQDLSNQGFQYPYKLNGGLKGGFETVEGLDQFTNIDNINYKPLDTLRGLYGDLAVPRKIYDCIYKDRYFAQFHDPSTIFKAAMNYFHKFNINQSAIFNNICYATLLINKAAFNESIKKITSIAEHIPDVSNKLGGSYPLSDNFKVTKCILVNSIQNGINMFDQAQNHMPVELVVKTPANPGSTDMKLSIRQFLFDEADFLKNVGNDNVASAITTILHFPSLNNNYFYSFMNGLFGTDKIRPLYSAFVVDGIRRLDAQCTYMHALFDWVKRTSFYNLEKDVDDFFSTQPDENPFDAI